MRLRRPASMFCCVPSFGGTLPAAIAALLVSSIASGAAACSCAGSKDPWSAVARAPIIFTGRAVAVDVDGPVSPVDKVSRRRMMHTTFEIIIPWKGVASKTVMISTVQDCASCGVTYSAGLPYTVIAYQGPDAYPPVEAGALTTNLCTMLPFHRDPAAFIAPLHDLLPTYLTPDAAAAPHPNLDIIRADAAFHVSAGNKARSLELLSSILTATPQDTDSLSDRAALNLASKRYVEALSDLNALIAIQPGHERPKHWRDIVLFKLNRLSEFGTRTPNLSQASYEYMDVSPAHLAGANFSRCTLKLVKFLDSDLAAADFRGARLIYFSLKNAKLADATFRGATLHDVDFSGADLRNADLRYMHMRGGNLEGALLTGAKYNGRTRWPQGFDPEAAGAVRVEED